MTEGPLIHILLLRSGLARRHEGTKKKSHILPFVRSCIRAQKSSVFRFIERAA